MNTITTAPVLFQDTNGPDHATQFSQLTAFSSPGMQHALAAGHALHGPVAITGSPFGDDLQVVSLQETGFVHWTPNADDVASMFGVFHALQVAPKVDVVVNGATTYVPLHGMPAGPAAKAGGTVWDSADWFDQEKLTIGPGIAGAGLTDAVEAASHLSAGDAGAYAVIGSATDGYTIHAITESGVSQTRLGPKPFSHPLAFEQAPDHMAYHGAAGLAANVAAIVDGNAILVPHADLA